jgi:hypothetical protein
MTYLVYFNFFLLYLNKTIVEYALNLSIDRFEVIFSLLYKWSKLIKTNCNFYSIDLHEK